MQRRKPKPTGVATLQVAYWQRLKKITRRAHALVQERLVPLLPALMERNNPAAYTDALPPGKRVNHVLEGIRNTLKKETAQDRLERGVKQVAKLVSDHNMRLLAAQGVDAKTTGTVKQMAAFTAENVGLIRSIPTDYLTDVEKTIHRAMAQGQRHETLAKELEERFSVSESKAKLIARDQVLKFGGALMKMRQQNAGIDSYIWRAAMDERTREAHAEFDGNTYTWAEGAGDGSAEEGTHPGEAVQCRCWAEPILQEVEDE